MSQYSKLQSQLINQNKDIYEVFMPDNTTLQSGSFNLQVARGVVPGVTGLSISGYNDAVGTTFVPLWHGNAPYVYPAVAMKMLVYSDNAADTNVSVQIAGLDTDYNSLTETVVLTNGVTGVQTVNSFLRINNMNLTRTPMNAGVIHIADLAKSNVYCAIEIGAGRSQQTTYTVPANNTFYLTQSNWYTNQTGNQTALYRSYTVNAAGVINTILTFPFIDQYNSVKVVPRPYAAKTDIQWQVASSTGTSKVGGQIEGYLISN